MSSHWLLPEHIADVLPAQARQIEDLRRHLLDTARGYGFELVMPPLMEHVQSLFSGSGQALPGRSFAFTDPLSGETVGVRADSTPQVARIDAHLLNRQGVTRLCYCGPVLHTQPAYPFATREPLQFGAEIYGHEGLEADLEVLDLALDVLAQAGLAAPVLDLSDARVLRGVLALWPDEVPGLAHAQAATDWLDALVHKDLASLQRLTAHWPSVCQSAVGALTALYGDVTVLDRAQDRLPDQPLIRQALSDLRALVAHVRHTHPQVSLCIDLAEQGGMGYYTGARFAVYAPGAAHAALLRGGRYDEVGAAFGRRRPAVGFGLDLKELAPLVPHRRMRAAIRAPWSHDLALRDQVRALRQAGEVVVCALPGHEQEVQEFDCDRELVCIADRWQLQALAAPSLERELG